MGKRKTIPVDDVRRKANDFLALGSNDPGTRPPKDFRRGVMALLEYVLFETDNYGGFKYLQPDDDAQLEDDTLRTYLVKS